MLTIQFIIWWEFAIFTDHPFYSENNQISKWEFACSCWPSYLWYDENLQFQLTILFIFIIWEFAILTDRPFYSEIYRISIWEFAFYVDHPVYNMMRICNFNWPSHVRLVVILEIITNCPKFLKFLDDPVYNNWLSKCLSVCSHFPTQTCLLHNFTLFSPLNFHL